MISVQSSGRSVRSATPARLQRGRTPGQPSSNCTQTSRCQTRCSRARSTKWATVCAKPKAARPRVHGARLANHRTPQHYTGVRCIIFDPGLTAATRADGVCSEGPQNIPLPLEYMCRTLVLSALLFWGCSRQFRRASPHRQHCAHAVLALFAAVCASPGFCSTVTVPGFFAVPGCILRPDGIHWTLTVEHGHVSLQQFWQSIPLEERSEHFHVQTRCGRCLL